LRQLARIGAATASSFERTPEDEAAGREELERFRMALGRLSEGKRLALLLADVEGLTGEQIAAALDIPLGTVWTRLHYARAELRKTLGRPVDKGGRT
jgi:RNA polymerase sigma-70 factor (ECF subfamily)